MEPTTSSGRSPQRFALDAERPPRDHNAEVGTGVSSDPNILPAAPLEGFGFEQPERRQPATPLWLRRVWLIIFVTFCVELGMLLAVLPWTQVWTNNHLIADYPALRAVLGHGFVRGLVTGLGVVDVWLGIAEAVRYRERK